MIHLQGNQTDVVREFLGSGKLLNLLDELPAQFVSVEPDPLANTSQQSRLIEVP
jgi:hypothetical protein